MSVEPARRLPPGTQPYDRLNGVRIGALTGGVIGLIPAVVWWPAFWCLLAGAVVGGVVGYRWQVREERRNRR